MICLHNSCAACAIVAVADVPKSDRVCDLSAFGRNVASMATCLLARTNIKRSRGGLRDIQLVRWIGFAAYGECDLDQLAQLQFLARRTIGR